ncbi:bifunctional 3-phenylpropionate/cinnamic acid dioxygenase ferredoxin subunit [Gordonia sp. N1V]|uniref:bifunctional 3-phenylpropionate/cinnamic acid dioxygenase ferredoxin subunit n=1 Tax=Gordonia sp. N1V TaxID=3034163 RepID=UPI0023E30EE1|nr:bifunctional 3-phenylpropionate/cinnamic acid dioxygenase ferredoxin subunit [Gordonia sp. N1V]MDF3282993.1 bifunctional 3-phenylpropionate/cinnamic acid dioxygenase ferredoxin subunit [Gordonia sp. N1V]
MTWTRVCATSDVDEGEAFRVETDPPIAVFRVEDEFFAIDDTCSHGQSSLADGYIDGCEVECAWHFGKFDIRTGRAVCFPASVDLRTHAVRVEGSDILVDTPDALLAGNLSNSSHSCGAISESKEK